jgi:hypothetical protein
MPTVRRRLRSKLLWGASLASAVAAACGGNPATVIRGGDAGDGSARAGADAVGAGGEPTLQLGGMTGLGEAGEPAVLLELRVTAAKEELELNGEPETVQLSARYEDGSVPNRVLWTVDNPGVGSISETGEFRANGFVGGAVTITATVGGQMASLTLHVSITISEDPDELDAEIRDALVVGGTGGPLELGPDADFRFLYPYDETVFPRGLAAPLLQLGGVGADATYVRVTTTSFSYEAFASSSGPTRVTLPEAVWRGITYSAGASEWVEVAVSKQSGGEVTGPVTARWLIAPGSLKGFVYYNTYRSKLAGDNGAVMRIKPGETATVLQSGCTVCHSVSAHGNVLVSGVQWDGDNAVVSRAFNLPENGGITLRNQQDDGRVYSFGGLTPDGTFMLTSGVPASGAKMRGMTGLLPTRLVDTATGQTVRGSGFAVDVAMTPNFSPDGSRVAFNNHDASAAGHVLGVMSYDGSQSPPEFSNLENLAEDAQRVLAWPSFLPDGSAVVFHAGDSFDTAKPKGGASYADLRLVDVATKRVSTLDALNGYDSDGNLYLPGGASQEAHLNYEPSVLPVPVAGYYWVLFTSRRTYGNTIAPGGTLARGDDIWGIPQGDDAESPSPRKKIWVAAIDLDHQGSPDPSHPAFYLPGQELEAGNMRAFAALEPCKKKGKGCESAAECCDGFCREVSRSETGEPVLQCTPPPENTCANIDEACKTSDDCCNSRSLCINARCAAPGPRPPR